MKYHNACSELGDDYFNRTPEAEQQPATIEDQFNDLIKHLDDDPSKDLNQNQASLLYGVYQGLPEDLQPAADVIKQKRGVEHDYDQVRGLVIERLRGEEYVYQTYGAYQTVTELLDLPDDFKAGERSYLEAFKRTMFGGESEAGELEAGWEQRGIFDHITKELLVNGIRYNVVPVPNAPVVKEKVVGLAEAFGKDQPYELHVYDEMYRSDVYDDQQISGYQEAAKTVRFRLMPSRFSNELSGQTVDAQNTLLKELQRTQPDLGFAVPSVLESVIHWQVLRAQGDPLIEYGAYAKTAVRHFDLPAHTFEEDDWLYVPRSFVGGAGKPRLVVSDVQLDDRGRVSVG